MGEQRCALTAIEMEQALAESGRRVSRASIYRILEELDEIGVVQRVEIGSGMARFEPYGAVEDIIIISCATAVAGWSRSLTRAFERAIKRASERVALDVSEHEVVLHGACNACAA
jgi:Fur family transcriptional regulator, ferric uptake regulator